MENEKNASVLDLLLRADLPDGPRQLSRTEKYKPYRCKGSF